MSAKRKRTMEDEDIAQELFLDSDSDDELTSHNSESDQDETQRDDKHWTDNTEFRHVVPVIHRFTEGS
jgi:hypothetical protein